MLISLQPSAENQLKRSERKYQAGQYFNSKADLNNIAQYSRAVLQVWKNYYGKYGRAELKHVLLFLNAKLAKWAKRKYKRLKTSAQAIRWIVGYQQREPKLFVHWSFTS